MSSPSLAESRKLYEYAIKECNLDPDHPIVQRALAAISAGQPSGDPPLFVVEDHGDRMMFKVTEFGRQALRPPDISKLKADVVAFMADHTPDEMRAKLREDIPTMSLEKAERVLEMALSLPLLAGESWQDRGEVITLARSVVAMKQQEAARSTRSSSSRRPVRRRRR